MFLDYLFILVQKHAQLGVMNKILYSKTFGFYYWKVEISQFITGVTISALHSINNIFNPDKTSDHAYTGLLRKQNYQRNICAAC